MRRYLIECADVMNSPQSFFKTLRRASKTDGCSLYSSFVLLLFAAGVTAFGCFVSALSTGQVVRGFNQVLSIASLTAGLYLIVGTTLAARSVHNARRIPMTGLAIYALYAGLSVMYIAKHVV